MWPIKVAAGKHITVKEIGGVVMPLWQQYLTADVIGLVFFLDMTAPAFASATVVELHKALQLAMQWVWR